MFAALVHFFYKTLYSPDTSSESCVCVGPEVVEQLEAALTLEELTVALHQLSKGKSLGLNRLTVVTFDVCSLHE